MQHVLLEYHTHSVLMALGESEHVESTHLSTEVCFVSTPICRIFSQGLPPSVGLLFAFGSAPAPSISWTIASPSFRLAAIMRGVQPLSSYWRLSFSFGSLHLHRSEHPKSILECRDQICAGVPVLEQYPGYLMTMPSGSASVHLYPYGKQVQAGPFTSQSADPFFFLHLVEKTDGNTGALTLRRVSKAAAAVQQFSIFER